MYSRETRQHALRELWAGRTLSSVSRELGVSRSALRDWRGHRPLVVPPVCPRSTDVPHAAYAALLGFYLGDGCLSTAPRTVVLRVSCDARYPGIIEDVTDCIEQVHAERRVFRVRAPGTIVVQNSWKHWPCLFPQHGPGRKHERPIVLHEWQRAIVEEHPWDLLRGLFHSDGARVANWATRVVAGVPKRYEYPRWQFVNRSEDILRLCGETLDAVAVPWRRSSRTTVSVSTRAGVAALDAGIGPKC